MVKKKKYIAFIMVIFATIGYGNQVTKKEGYCLTKEINKNSSETEITTHTYDTNGYKIKTVVGVDLNGDLAISTKEIKFIEQYAYNKNGKKLSTFLSKANGSIKSIETYTYDGNGNMLSESYDRNADKEADDIKTYTYDGNGNKLSYKHDHNGDGVVDTVRSYTYDDKGKELSFYMGNADGSVNMVTFYTYDGNMRIGKEDENGDGVVDFTQIWIYDNNGNKLSYKSYSKGNNKANNIKTYTYDKSGNMLTESEDFTGDGVVDFVATYAYDSAGNMLSEKFTDKNMAERTIIMTYDNNGNILTKIFYFNDNKDTASSTHTYIYTKGIVPAGYKKPKSGTFNSLYYGILGKRRK